MPEWCHRAYITVNPRRMTEDTATKALRPSCLSFRFKPVRKVWRARTEIARERSTVVVPSWINFWPSANEIPDTVVVSRTGSFARERSGFLVVRGVRQPRISSNTLICFGMAGWIIDKISIVPCPVPECRFAALRCCVRHALNAGFHPQRLTRGRL